MGNSQGNNRRFTMYNDSPSGVIQLSESVASRLQGTHKSQQQSNQPQQQDSNEKYWNQRMNQLQQQNAEVHKNMENEYNKAFEEIEKSFPKRLLQTQKLPCQDMKSKILECYKTNPGKALACAKEVEAFSSCVNNIREDILC